MTESKIETTKGNCAIALTRHIMDKFNLPQDKAFAKLVSTEFFGLLNDTETNLFMEKNDYLCTASDIKLARKTEHTDSINRNNCPRKIIHADKKNKRICKIEQIRLFRVDFL